MGKHARPVLRPECSFDAHFGPIERTEGDRSVMWFCDNCGACTGVSAMVRTTSTGVLLAAVPDAT